MQCEKVCPVDCIKIDSIKPPKDSGLDCGLTSNDTQKKMIVSRFTIDMSECMYCNLCVFPCPEECIYMVGGPNDNKHEIDYEFSQYKRDGMIFEFADATDEIIRDAGGEKWLEQRDANQTFIQDGIDLKGVIKATEPTPVEIPAPSVSRDSSPQQKVPVKPSTELAINAFNVIADKMCRGIAKKAFTASKRAGKDNVLILADVAQALSDAGKMTADIQKILDSLVPSVKSNEIEVANDKIIDSSSSVETSPIATTEMDIKDLNSIEDKMIRGTAKKAFTAAKRSGEDKVKAIRDALQSANLMDDSIEKLLNSFITPPQTELGANKTGTNDQSDTISKSSEEVTLIDSHSDSSIFEITELNGIEDKMARGMAKKIYTAGKRANKSRQELIEDIRSALNDANKIDESCEKVLNDLESST
jgi:NAD-dependent dihydropyrimidine dehydrogenase PreA subunit